MTTEERNSELMQTLDDVAASIREFGMQQDQ